MKSKEFGIKNQTDAMDYIIRMVDQTYPCIQTGENGYTGIAYNGTAICMDNINSVAQQLKRKEYINSTPLTFTLDRMIQMHQDAIFMLKNARKVAEEITMLPNP